MTPKIESIQSKLLVGIRVKTTLTTDNPVVYWKPFKMGLSEIENAITDKFYSVQIMDKMDGPFTPDTTFEKWAAAEVSHLGNVPNGMETLRLPEGKYAIFTHKGTPASFPQTMQYIFGEWIPNSEYKVDNRPHFEVMDKDYRIDDENAEELVYVPIR